MCPFLNGAAVDQSRNIADFTGQGADIAGFSGTAAGAFDHVDREIGHPLGDRGSGKFTVWSDGLVTEDGADG